MPNKHDLCKNWTAATPPPATTLVVGTHPHTGGVHPMGTPTFTSPLHYDSGDGPGIHFDLFYDPGVGVTHTLRSITVTCDTGSPYTKMEIRHPNGTTWISPTIPPGTGTFTKAQINAQGFTVLEDCASFTAEP